LFDRQEKWRVGADIKDASFGRHQLMFPVRAGVEIPVETSGENVQRVAGCRIGGTGGSARSAGKAGVAADGEADTIGVGKLVAEIAGEERLRKASFCPWPSLEVGARSRESRHREGADLRAAAGAGKNCRLRKKIEGRGARGPLVREKLNNADMASLP